MTELNARHCDSSGQGHWYVLHCIYSYEKLITRWLNWLKLEWRRPVVSTYRPRKKPVESSLFPGYIFVRFEKEDLRWRSLHEIPGVIRLISSSEDNPTPLPDGFLENLLEYHEKRLLLLSRAKIGPDIGDEVEILTGPFAKFIATCEWSKNNLLGLRLSIFGRMTEVTLSPSDVFVLKYVRDQSLGPP